MNLSIYSEGPIPWLRFIFLVLYVVYSLCTNFAFVVTLTHFIQWKSHLAKTSFHRGACEIMPKFIWLHTSSCHLRMTFVFLSSVVHFIFSLRFCSMVIRIFFFWTDRIRLFSVKVQLCPRPLGFEYRSDMNPH